MRSPTLEYDMRRVDGVAALGVHCDYCHKVAEAPLDRIGTRFGKDGLRLLRPANDDQLFFGPLDDAVRPGESFAYAPFYKKSGYCASCHEGIVFGVHVYGTYSEWLESPARKNGLECQSCHMAPTGAMTNIAPGKGGIERPAHTLASHHLPGSTLDMLRSCLEVEISARLVERRMQVEVVVRAERVGHRVPTGFIDRNLVLVVEASDAAGGETRPLEGSVIGAGGGERYQGKAGWLYAKQVQDEAGRGPLPFWKPHERVVDTRLHPGAIDRRAFLFAAGSQQVRVRLLYRRLWPTVAESRKEPVEGSVVVDRVVAAR
jgi:hypothetical protein